MWRPNDWEELCEEYCPDMDRYDPDPMIADKAFEAGADAMYKAIIDEIIRVEYDTLRRLGVRRLTDEQAVLFIESLRRHLTETEDGNS